MFHRNKSKKFICGICRYNSYPGINKIFGLAAGDDISSDDLQLRMQLFDFLDHPNLKCGVSLAGVKYNHVHPSLGEELEPLQIPLMRRHGRSYQQLLVGIL